MVEAAAVRTLLLLDLQLLAAVLGLVPPNRVETRALLGVPQDLADPKQVTKTILDAVLDNCINPNVEYCAEGSSKAKYTAANFARCNDD